MLRFDRSRQLLSPGAKLVALVCLGAIVANGVHAKIYAKKADFSILGMPLKANLEFDVARDKNDLLLQEANLHMDVSLEGGPQLAKIKVDHIEELHACDNLTVVKPERIRTIACQGADGPENNPDGVIVPKSSYSRSSKYVRRQNFRIRLKHERLINWTADVKLTLYPKRGPAAEVALERALNRYDQPKLSSNGFALDGYYAEARFSSVPLGRRNSEHVCSGDLILSLNKTDFGRDYTDRGTWSVLLKPESLSMIDIKDFTCIRNSDRSTSLESNLFYARRDVVPYSTLYHTTNLTGILLLKNNSSQSTLGSEHDNLLSQHGIQGDGRNYTEYQNHALSLFDGTSNSLLRREILHISTKLLERIDLLIFDYTYLAGHVNYWTRAGITQKGDISIFRVDPYNRSLDFRYMRARWEDQTHRTYKFDISKKGLNHYLNLLSIEPEYLEAFKRGSEFAQTINKAFGTDQAEGFIPPAELFSRL